QSNIVEGVRKPTEQQKNYGQPDILRESNEDLRKTYAEDACEDQGTGAISGHRRRRREGTDSSAGANRRFQEAVAGRTTVKRPVGHDDENRKGHPREKYRRECQSHR